MTVYDSLEEIIVDTQNHNWHRRALAARAMAARSEPQTVGILIALLNDPIERVREEAAYALATIGDERAIQPLIDCFIDPSRTPTPDEDGDVSYAIPQAVKRFGKSAIQYLVPYLQDLSQAWHDGVLWLLGYLAYPEAVQPLIEAYYRATHEAEQDMICRVLHQINSPLAEQFLHEIRQ